MDFIRDPGLMFYIPLWKKDGSVIYSEDARGLAGTVTEAVWQYNGRYFDGTNDLIDFGNNHSFTGEFSIECWVMRGRTGAWEAIIGKSLDNGLQSNYDIGFSNAHSNILFELSYNAGTFITLNTLRPVLANEWIHFVGVHKLGLLEGYANGELVRTTTYSGTVDTTTTSLKLGTRRPAADFFQGIIGEVRIYNRALTLGEIQRNYLATKWRYK